MLHIAVCDDAPEELALTVKYLREYLAAEALLADVRQFAHPDALLSSCQTEKFHLYLLDVVMPMVNGVQLGREIRRVDREAQIIFTTSHPAFALDAFAANPVNYLLKPVDKRQLFDTLSLALSRVRPDDATISVKLRDGLRIVPVYAIVCCEYVTHSVRYYLRGGEMLSSVSSRTPFSVTVEPLLRQDCFLQPHNAFVLNMAYVEQLTRDEFILRGGLHVPISKKQYAAARDAYLDYRFGQEAKR